VHLHLQPRGGPVGRTLPSVFAQTYEPLEVIVVGDHCTDNTESLVEQLGDPRVRFVNLPHQGVYPVDPVHRWMVAGTLPRTSPASCRAAIGSPRSTMMTSSPRIT